MSPKRSADGARASASSFQVLGFHGKESLDDRRRLFPAPGFGLQLLAALPCQPIEARLAVVFRRSPFGLDRSFLHQLEQDRVERPLIDRQQIPADLLDSAGDPVAVLW